MEVDSILLGLVIYFLLIGILIIINEAFCKTACINNARRINDQSPPDVELNERRPKKTMTTEPKRNHAKGDMPQVHKPRY